MNTRILLLALSVAAFSSCSVYRSGQTPDDVYYSPAPVQTRGNAGGDDEYVDVRQPKQGTSYQSYEQYQDSYRDDRFLRMSIGNPYYLNAYNGYSGFDWRSNSFYDGFNYGFNSPWNNYFAWNNYYNPYSYYGNFGGGYYGGGHVGGYGYGYGAGVIVTNRAPISRPVVFNVNSYSNGNRSSSTNRSYLNSYNNGQRYNNGNGSGNRTNNSYYNNNSSNNRNSYTPANSNSGNNNNYTPSRSYTPSSSGSSSSGGSSGGGGSVSRPTRGN